MTDQGMTSGKRVAGDFGQAGMIAARAARAVREEKKHLPEKLIPPGVSGILASRKDTPHVIYQRLCRAEAYWMEEAHACTSDMTAHAHKALEGIQSVCRDYLAMHPEVDDFMCPQGTRTRYGVAPHP